LLETGDWSSGAHTAIPLYTATLAILNARCVPYYLDESKAWGTDMSAIKDAMKKAKSEGTDVRAIVVINPGNPPVQIFLPKT
jgi:alanine transaminase